MRYWWNDKEVSEEEYQNLENQWRKTVEEAEAAEKNKESESSRGKNSSRKKSGN
jgi:hypothetical protein